MKEMEDVEEMAHMEVTEDIEDMADIEVEESFSLFLFCLCRHPGPCLVFVNTFESVNVCQNRR